MSGVPTPMVGAGIPHFRRVEIVARTASGGGAARVTAPGADPGEGVELALDALGVLAAASLPVQVQGLTPRGAGQMVLAEGRVRVPDVVQGVGALVELRRRSGEHLWLDVYTGDPLITSVGGNAAVAAGTGVINYIIGQWTSGQDINENQLRCSALEGGALGGAIGLTYHLFNENSDREPTWGGLFPSIPAAGITPFYDPASKLFH